MVNDMRLSEVFTVYRSKLADAMAANPGDYMPGLTADVAADKLEGRVRADNRFGGININSKSWKATCKAFGIKHTYKALDALIAEPL